MISSVTINKSFDAQLNKALMTPQSQVMKTIDVRGLQEIVLIDTSISISLTRP
jgi:hypothetical protein